MSANGDPRRPGPGGAMPNKADTYKEAMRKDMERLMAGGPMFQLPVKRAGTVKIAGMDDEVQALWDAARATSSSEERARLLREIGEVGLRQLGDSQ